MDGRKVKTTIKSSGPNKLIQEERDPKSGKLVSVMIREVNAAGELIAV